MTHQFEVTDSTVLFDGPLIGLRRDRVTMPGGGEATREIVEHFGAAAIVAYDEEREAIAVVKQYRHSVGKRLLEIPAGLLDIAGESALDAAKRELQEEAGLAAKCWEVLVDLAISPGFCDEATRIFLARDLTDIGRDAGHDEEADMANLWLSLPEAVAMIFAGEIHNATAVAGILAADAVLAGRANACDTTANFELRPTRLAQRRRDAGVSPDMKKR